MVNEPPGAWWIGRVVRFEWKGLYKGEEDNICVVQWLKVDSWERSRASAVHPLRRPIGRLRVWGL